MRSEIRIVVVEADERACPFRDGGVVEVGMRLTPECGERAGSHGGWYTMEEEGWKLFERKSTEGV